VDVARGQLERMLTGHFVMPTPSTSGKPGHFCAACPKRRKSSKSGVSVQSGKDGKQYDLQQAARHGPRSLRSVPQPITGSPDAARRRRLRPPWPSASQ